MKKYRPVRLKSFVNYCVGMKLICGFFVSLQAKEQT